MPPWFRIKKWRFVDQKCKKKTKHWQKFGYQEKSRAKMIKFQRNFFLQKSKNHWEKTQKKGGKTQKEPSTGKKTKKGGKTRLSFLHFDGPGQSIEQNNTGENKTHWGLLRCVWSEDRNRRKNFDGSAERVWRMLKRCSQSWRVLILELFAGGLGRGGGAHHNVHDDGMVPPTQSGGKKREGGQGQRATSSMPANLKAAVSPCKAVCPNESFGSSAGPIDPQIFPPWSGVMSLPVQ